MLKITIEKALELKQKPDDKTLGFGRVFTDHMFVMDYTDVRGWHDAKIVPFADITLSPAAMVFHYGQEMFEGLKAYRHLDNRVYLFRPEMNAKRFNRSNERLCMPQIPVEDFVEAVRSLVEIDSDWVPKTEGTSLYIRPFMIATDPSLMVHPSHTYKFMIILSPVGAYYKEGINPVKIWVETEYVRAVAGGVGYAKTGGNYAASLIAAQKAQEKGYSQVLWLDAKEHKYIEEVGTMNIFFKIKGQIWTPNLSGSILPGVTRDACVMLLKDMGYEVLERRIAVDELFEAARTGELEEVFGTGTAAVISPVGELNHDGSIITVNQGLTGEVASKLYEKLTGIQYGHEVDEYAWVVGVAK